MFESGTCIHRTIVELSEGKYPEVDLTSEIKKIKKKNDIQKMKDLDLNKLKTFDFKSINEASNTLNKIKKKVFKKFNKKKWFENIQN